MKGTQPDFFDKTQQNLGRFRKVCMRLGVCSAVLSKHSQDPDGEDSFDTLIESTRSARDDANIVLNRLRIVRLAFHALAPRSGSFRNISLVHFLTLLVDRPKLRPSIRRITASHRRICRNKRVCIFASTTDASCSSYHFRFSP